MPSRPATYDLAAHLREQMQDPDVAAAVKRGDAYPHQKFAADFLSRMLPLGGDPHLVQFDCGTGKTGVVSLLCQNILPHKRVALVTVGQLVFQTGSLVAQTFAQQHACRGKTPIAPVKGSRTFLIEGEMFDVALGMYGESPAPRAARPAGAAGSGDVATPPSEHEAAEEVEDEQAAPRPPPRKKQRRGDVPSKERPGSLAWLRKVKHEYGERRGKLLCVVNKGLQGLDKFLEDFDVVICDEAHLYATLVKKLAHNPALRLVALTATPSASILSVPWHILSLKLDPEVNKLLGISRVEIIPSKKQVAEAECVQYWKRFARQAVGELERSVAMMDLGRDHFYQNVNVMLATTVAVAAGRLKIAELTGDHTFDGDHEELPGPETVSRCCHHEGDEEVRELYRRAFSRKAEAFREAVAALVDAGHPFIIWAAGSRGSRYEIGDGPRFHDASLRCRIHDCTHHIMFGSWHKTAEHIWNRRRLDHVVEAVLTLRPSLFPVIVRVDSLGVERVAARLKEVMDPHDSLTTVCNGQGQWRCKKVRDVVVATEQTRQELEDTRTWRTIMRLLTLKPKRDLFNRTMEAAGGTVGETIMAYVNPRLTNRDVVLTDASMSVGFNIQNSFSSILCTSLPCNDEALMQQIGRLRRMHGWLPITCRMYFRGDTYDEYKFEKNKPGWEAAVM